MARPPSDRGATILASVASAAMVAFQLAGKATRDALFLSTFPIATLPRMVIAAALLSALCTIGLSRVMARTGPARLVPALFGASALLLLAEWALAAPFHGPVVVLYYLHFSALGALLISGFWAMVTERFDPRTARVSIARITTGASIGGLLGGLLSAPLGGHLALTSILPLLALLHLVTAALVLGLRPTTAAASGTAGDAEPLSAGAVFRSSRHLRRLVVLVVLAAMTEGLLDWAFKARALASGPTGEELLRFFALFYTATALLGLLLQTTAVRPAFSRLGFARTAALLPAGVSLGALGGLLLPGFPPLILARGSEIVLRNSFFRGAYELLFTPVPATEKRVTKLLVDVGATRLGDMAGGAVVQVLLLVAGTWAGGLALGASIALALGTLVVARRLHHGYADALARSLSAHAGQLPELSDDPGALLQTVGGFDLRQLRDRPAESSAAAGPAPTAPLPMGRREALASRDPEVVTGALEAGPLTPELVGDAVRLLAWDAVAPAAIRALTPAVPAAVGTLVARLVDPDEDFAIRRRLVRVLVETPTPEIFAALHEALSDRRFEVRYLAGRALYRQTVARGELVVDRDRIRDAVLTEVAVGRGVWESRRLIDAADDESAPMETALIRDRADRSLEHVFTLLALILPRDPLRLAYHGLHTADRHLRGTALEYLESVLPPDVRERLWPFLEPGERPGEPRRGDAGEALGRLLASRESIVLALEAVRERWRESGGRPAQE